MDLHNYEPWDLKYDISHFIVPRLRMYIEKVEKDEIMTIPNWVKNQNESSNQDELRQEWINILNQMMVPFHFNIAPTDYTHLSPDDLEKQKAQGLKYFAQYFEHLWD